MANPRRPVLLILPLEDVELLARTMRQALPDRYAPGPAAARTEAARFECGRLASLLEAACASPVLPAAWEALDLALGGPGTIADLLDDYDDDDDDDAPTGRRCC